MEGIVITTNSKLQELTEPLVLEWLVVREIDVLRFRGCCVFKVLAPESGVPAWQVMKAAFRVSVTAHISMY